MKVKDLVAMIALPALLAPLAACGGADAPVIKSVSTSGYTLMSEKANPATGALVVNIKVPQPDETTVKSIAESLINSRKAQYPTITVNTFVESIASNDIPYCVSKLDAGVVSHKVDPKAAQQRVPPH
ncbi:MAG: hypothetical protein ACREDR_01660 [Blastocatellia bacterium]